MKVWTLLLRDGECFGSISVVGDGELIPTIKSCKEKGWDIIPICLNDYFEQLDLAIDFENSH